MRIIFKFLDKKVKRNLIIILILSFFIILLETLSVAAIFPLMKILLDTEYLKNISILKNFLNVYGENTIFVSAKNGSGINHIKFAINQVLDQMYLNTKLSFNNNYGPITNWLYEHCKIISKKNIDFNRYNYDVKITKINLKKLMVKYPFVKILR